jgi:lysozyme family protein
MSEHTESFQRAVAWVISVEGGYANDPDDRGGATRFGISQRSYPEIDLDSLTRADAEDIYWRDYWCPAACDLVPEPIGLALFDGAVQHGVSQSVKLMQDALHVRADGINGPITRAAVAKGSIEWISEQHLLARALLYHDLTIADSSQARFLPGWLRRLFQLQRIMWIEP